MATDESSTLRPFREEAVQAYLQGEPEGGILRVAAPRAWVLFWILCAVVTTLVLGSFIGQVELTSRGRGIIRPIGGVRPLTTLIAGTVAEVFVASGDAVVEGQILARLESAALEAELHTTEQGLAIAEADLHRFVVERSRHFDDRASLLEQDGELLRRRIKSQDATIARLEARAPSLDKLRENGLLTAQAHDDTREQLEQARRERLGLQEALAQSALQGSTLHSSKTDERWRLEQAVVSVQAKRDALAFALTQTNVVAPQAGYMEAVLVRPGDQVAVGAPVGKLLPSRLPSQIVSFLPEKDRAFVRTGQLVRVEVDQLPYSEFGPLTARIGYISQDLASPYEVRDAFGESVQVPGPTFRVELEFSQTDTLNQVASMLRPGMLGDVRYTLRRRRIITLVLDPLLRWWR
jgi:multidrug resistance efflux pump